MESGAHHEPATRNTLMARLPTLNTCRDASGLVASSARSGMPSITGCAGMARDTRIARRTTTT